jgi:ABC-type glycerol-3-phosphate transport system substrate-binding protein
MSRPPKFYGLVSLALSALLVLAACGGAPPSPTAAPAKPAEPTKPAAAAPTAASPAKPAAAGAIKLSFLGSQSADTQRALSLVLTEYQKTKPNVDIEWDWVPFAQLFPKIQASAAAKTPIDIIMADGPNV